jgi:hypothetical protein
MEKVFVIIGALWILAALLIIAPQLSLAQIDKNALCLTESEFTDVNAMGQTATQRLQSIRDWLDGLVPGSPGYGRPPNTPSPGILRRPGRRSSRNS